MASSFAYLPEPQCRGLKDDETGLGSWMPTMVAAAMANSEMQYILAQPQTCRVRCKRMCVWALWWTMINVELWLGRQKKSRLFGALTHTKHAQSEWSDDNRNERTGRRIQQIVNTCTCCSCQCGPASQQAKMMLSGRLLQQMLFFGANVGLHNLYSNCSVQCWQRKGTGPFALALKRIEWNIESGRIRLTCHYNQQTLPVSRFTCKSIPLPPVPSSNCLQVKL